MRKISHVAVALFAATMALQVSADELPTVKKNQGWNGIWYYSETGWATIEIKQNGKSFDVRFTSLDEVRCNFTTEFKDATKTRLVKPKNVKCVDIYVDSNGNEASKPSDEAFEFGEFELRKSDGALLHHYITERGEENYTTYTSELITQ